MDFKRCKRDHAWDVLAGWRNVELFAVLRSSKNKLLAESLQWCERVECCRILSVPAPRVLVYYSNAVISDHPNGGVIWNVAALELVTLERMSFLAAAEKALSDMDATTLSKGHGDVDFSSDLQAGYIVVPIFTASLCS